MKSTFSNIFEKSSPSSNNNTNTQDLVCRIFPHLHRRPPLFPNKHEPHPAAVATWPLPGCPSRSKRAFLASERVWSIGPLKCTGSCGRGHLRRKRFLRRLDRWRSGAFAWHSFGLVGGMMGPTHLVEGCCWRKGFNNMAGAFEVLGVSWNVWLSPTNLSRTHRFVVFLHLVERLYTCCSLWRTNS